ncbi:MAG: response regulator, partial [Thiotrichaceae bacterium]|nr:response regulator [Thiotrichaceae bacterium]
MKKTVHNKIRVLLVDDEEAFRVVIARRLGKRGFIILQASDGEKCLEILAKDPVDVVVLDVKMPGLSGIETLKIIKQRYKNIQVILLT